MELLYFGAPKFITLHPSQLFFCAMTRIVANQMSQFYKNVSAPSQLLYYNFNSEPFCAPQKILAANAKQTNQYFEPFKRRSTPDRQHCNINYTTAVLLPFSPPAPSKPFPQMSSNDSNHRSSRRVSRACGQRSLSAGTGITSIGS